jgi:epoxyqueuosine reductase
MDSSTSDKIKNKALEIGFSKIGIARSEISVTEGKRLSDWLQRGFHASMQWMERDVVKRIDPARVLPNAKSIVCVALNYYSSIQHSNDPSVGKISRYAWGDDYHQVMIERLERLFEFIKSVIPGVNGKSYVDTGPVMDKAWAVRSGIGWIGKHSNVINPEYGSWLFLGEILLDAELEYDNPMLDHCGTCTACIDACPTSAIVQPYVVDSNKCISYLTIEHRGELPANVISKFQNWVYGCDICQDVCPWNRFQKETMEAVFQPRSKNIAPKLNELAEMDQEEFSKRFTKSPIKRTKLAGLQRNARALLESQASSE